MGTAMRWKSGFKDKPVLQKNHSLGAYRQITPGQGTVNGRSLLLLTQGLAAPKEIISSKPQRISLSTQDRVTMWFSPPQCVAENKNMSLKRDEMKSPRIAPGGG